MGSCVTLYIPSRLGQYSPCLEAERRRTVCVCSSWYWTHTYCGSSSNVQVRMCVHTCILYVYTRCVVVGVSFVMCTMMCMCRYVLHVCVDTVCMGEYCTYVWICMYVCVDPACMGEYCTYVWICMYVWLLYIYSVNYRLCPALHSL